MDDDILKEMIKLNDQRQFQSATTLANLVIFKSQKSPLFYGQYARSLHGIGKYRKATKYCAKAIDLTHSIPEQYEMLLLAADCHQKIRNYKNSYQLYKKVPFSHHSIQSLMEMAKSASFTNAEGIVIEILQEVLKRNPYCIEAAFELIHLGHFSSSLIILSNSSLDNRNKFLKFYSLYLSRYAEVYNRKQGKESESPIRLNIASGISNQDWLIVPSSDVVMLRARALNAIYDGDFCEAVRIYKKVTAIDKETTDDMHFYAYSLKKIGTNTNSLRVLTYLMLHLAPESAETWLIVAMWYDNKKMRDLSLQHVQRSISLNSRLWLSYLFRTELFLSLENESNAFRSIRQAWSLCKRPCVAEMYLELAIKKDSNNLMVHANEIYKNLGGSNSALALALLARAQANNPKYYSNAQKLLEKCLEMDPRCAAAYSALSFLQYHSSSSNMNLDSNIQFEKAISILQKGIAHNPCDRLYMDLGELYLKKERLHDSLSCFLKILQNNPSNEKAALLADEVQSLIKGQLNLEHDYLDNE